MTIFSKSFTSTANMVVFTLLVFLCQSSSYNCHGNDYDQLKKKELMDVAPWFEAAQKDTLTPGPDMHCVTSQLVCYFCDDIVAPSDLRTIPTLLSRLGRFTGISIFLAGDEGDSEQLEK